MTRGTASTTPAPARCSNSAPSRGAAAKDTADSQQMQDALKSVSIYALKPDIEARGMQNRVMDGVRLVDYGGFVDLVAEHNAVQSWL